MVAYMKQAGSDEWDDERTETLLTGDGEPQCGIQDGEPAESVLILKQQLSPGEALKFGLD